MDKLIYQLKKERLCSPSTKATIVDDIITLDDHRRFAQFKINPSKEIPSPLYIAAERRRPPILIGE